MRLDREKIRKHLCIKALAEKYGANGWRQVGGGKLLGLCPFHADTNPSLWVDLHEGRFKCFGSCDEPTFGDVFTMIAKAEGLDASTEFRKILEIAQAEVNHG